MLPPQFSTPRLDEQGRRYVVHEPSGVIYYVREQDARGGKVTTYTRNASFATSWQRSARAQPKAQPPKRAEKKQQQQQARRLDGLARATFIEGSAP